VGRDAHRRGDADSEVRSAFGQRREMGVVREPFFEFSRLERVEQFADGAVLGLG